MRFWEKIKKNSVLITIGSLIVLFFIVYLADLIFITVYPGYAGVLFRRIFNPGTVINKVYDEGLNIIAPWNKMYVYDVRIQEKKQCVNVLSQNGLTIEVVVSLRYHIARDQAPVLHKKVGPKYEEKIIIPSIISSVREVVGEYRPEEIYTTARHLIQDKLLIEVIEETGRIPIIYDDVIVENIALPELINKAIEMKLKQQQEYLEYEFRIKKAEKEIERKEKEATGISKFQKIVTESLTPDLLKWKGIMATLELAKSSNTKVIIVGGENGLPIIFNADTTSSISSDSLNVSSERNALAFQAEGSEGEDINPQSHIEPDGDEQPKIDAIKINSDESMKSKEVTLSRVEDDLKQESTDKDQNSKAADKAEEVK